MRANVSLKRGEDLLIFYYIIRLTSANYSPVICSNVHAEHIVRQQQLEHLAASYIPHYHPVTVCYITKRWSQPGQLDTWALENVPRYRVNGKGDSL